MLHNSVCAILLAMAFCNALNEAGRDADVLLEWNFNSVSVPILAGLCPEVMDILSLKRKRLEA